MFQSRAQFIILQLYYYFCGFLIVLCVNQDIYIGREVMTAMWHLRKGVS